MEHPILFVMKLLLVTRSSVFLLRTRILKWGGKGKGVGRGWMECLYMTILTNILFLKLSHTF